MVFKNVKTENTLSVSDELTVMLMQRSPLYECVEAEKAQPVKAPAKRTAKKKQTEE